MQFSIRLAVGIRGHSAYDEVGELESDDVINMIEAKLHVSHTHL